ncbi:LysR family transcriptional regulator [Marivita sp. S2033]|uniref:LysR family transcriptional regulator n=1 Tax=Marivita sp. S2033 TaxID=3373187 RepID=UPI003981D8D2
MVPIPITLRQIDYVIATADTGSTASAARFLNVSQPSVSLALSKVETHLGRPLFVRTAGQGVALTAFGQRKLGEFRTLRRQAQTILGAGDDAPEVVTLGVFSTLGPRYAPRLVREFERTNASARVHLREGDIETLTGWLESGQIDVALIYDFGLPSSLDVTPLADVRPYGVLPGHHHLTDRHSISMAELLEDPLILVNLPHSRGYFLTLAQMHGITPRIAFETGSVEMLRAMVANGMGVGLLATDIPHDTAYDTQPVVHMPLSGDLAPHRIALARIRQLRGSRATDAFCDYAIEMFKSVSDGKV